MTQDFLSYLQKQIDALKENGLYKQERLISSPQGAHIRLTDQKELLNFCSNNYLGLANHPKLVAAAKKSLDQFGFGLASVRFICGTQTLHVDLEKRLSQFLKMEETILYSSCFDANGGLFETLFGEEDAIISDALNHASIIDGIRLSKSLRLRYQHNDMQDLEEKLKESQHCRYRLIATDGVFSMDGTIANLRALCDLADKYNALVMVDDSHAVGFLGPEGRGTHEYCDVVDRIHILTGTLGKALGGASGGFTSGKKEIIEWLRQRSRPYLFSNTLAPTITSTSLALFDLLDQEGKELRAKLFKNTHYFRQEMEVLGFKLMGRDHPIIPIFLGDAKLAQLFAQKILKLGIYVIGFFYPVVPQGMARIRTQISAAHSINDIDRAIEAFKTIGRELNVIS